MCMVMFIGLIGYFGVSTIILAIMTLYDSFYNYLKVFAVSDIFGAILLALSFYLI